MNIKRQSVIEQIEKARTYVSNRLIVISDNERNALEDVLNTSERIAKYGRYHVTALGVFSTGKSTLLNAMLGAEYLPAADLPTTAITTEIFATEESVFFIPIQQVDATVEDSVRNGLTRMFGGEAVYINSLERDGEVFSGVGGKFKLASNKILAEIITELTSQQKRKKDPFLQLKKLLDANHDISLWLGISNLPNWLQDIVLTDAPGTGSIDECHEIVINKIIPESQLVLYLIEAEKAGSAIDKRFCNRISNTWHRKIFYILNKIDRQKNDERIEAMDCARRSVPEVTAKGEKPEFLQVSGLYAHIANCLNNNNLTWEEVCNNNEKVNLTKLLISPQWHDAQTDSAKQALVAQFLMENSLYGNLQKRIEEYLETENRDLVIADQASDCIARVIANLKRGCDNAIKVLDSDITVEELKKKRDEAHRLRLTYSREAASIIEDFKISQIDSNTGIEATIKGMLCGIPDAISLKLKEILEDSTQYKKFMKKEILQTWITKELNYALDEVLQKLNQDANKRQDHLFEQLLPILLKIESNGSLGKIIAPDLNVKAKDVDATGRVSGIGLGSAAVAGGAAWALTALGVGVSTTTTTSVVAGTGAAAWCAAHTGFGWLAGTAAWFGMGTMPTTVATTSAVPFFGLGAAGFFIPVIAIAALAGTVTALLIFNKKWKIEKIIKQTNELLRTLVIKGGVIGEEKVEPIVKGIYNSMKDRLSLIGDEINKRIELRLQQIDDEEEQILLTIDKAQNERDDKRKNLKKLSDELDTFAKQTKQSLKVSSAK